jgi:hypothetical protein
VSLYTATHPRYLSSREPGEPHHATREGGEDARAAHAWLIFASSSASIGVTSSGFSPAPTRFCAAPSIRWAARRIPMSSGSERVSSKRCCVRTCSVCAVYVQRTCTCTCTCTCTRHTPHARNSHARSAHVHMHAVHMFTCTQCTARTWSSVCSRPSTNTLQPSARIFAAAPAAKLTTSPCVISGQG